MDHSPNTDTPQPGPDKSFGLVFAAVFLLVALWPLLSHRLPYAWAMAVSGGFAACAYLKPSLLAPLNRLWFRFGMLLHRIISPAILFIMFCITILPTGLIMRLMGKDPLRLRFDPRATSYWIERAPPGQPDHSMKNQF